MRTIENFNKDWGFHLGNDLGKEILGYGNQVTLSFEVKLWQKAGNHGISKADNPFTKDWRKVQVPHDYALEGEFTSKSDCNNGALEHGEAWYVKRFELNEEDKNRSISLEFDGVYRNCSVYVNGFYMGQHLSGYTSFAYDISDVCFFDKTNCVAIYVDARQSELWSYEGAGIYREVRLVKKSKVAVAHWGIFVQTGDENDPGMVNAEITIDNKDYAKVNCVVTNRIKDGEETLAETSEEVHVDDWAKTTYNAQMRLDNPNLWSPDSPYLYTLETSIAVDGQDVDCYKTPFGVRYFSFDGNSGFSINGENMKIKGVCVHQDHGCVGVAVPPAIQEWRIRKLKEMGANAIRTSHNPADPTLLDICDKLGMMVMDETRLGGTSPEMLQQLTDLILRGRNHPSVIFWSLGNEEMNLQPTAHGLKMHQRMKHLANSLDPSRPTTYAMNANWEEVALNHGIHKDKRFDVFGFNYLGGEKNRGPHNFDFIHQKFPDWPMVQTESWGGTGTRDQYTPDTSILPIKLMPNYENSDSTWKLAEYKHFVTDYGACQTPWGNFVEETWQNCVERPFLSGTFYWTGFDYRGETFPYLWPAVITRFGLIDLCGYYKAPAHYLKAWWNPEIPHVFVLPHWDWVGEEGKEKRVWVYANTPKVELFLNGKSFGTKDMPANGKLEWFVPFEPGVLEAKGLSEDDEVIHVGKRVTPKAPEQISLEAERLSYQNYEDIIIVHVAINDKDGNIYSRADNVVKFDVEGPAEIIGVGNGNPMSHEPDLFTNKRKAFNGLCQVILRQLGGKEEPVKIVANSWGLEKGEIIV